MEKIREYETHSSGLFRLYKGFVVNESYRCPIASCHGPMTQGHLGKGEVCVDCGYWSVTHAGN